MADDIFKSFYKPLFQIVQPSPRVGIRSVVAAVIRNACRTGSDCLPFGFKELLPILETHLPALQMEIADTSREEFRRELKQREKIMIDLINRLKEASGLGGPRFQG